MQLVSNNDIRRTFVSIINYEKKKEQGNISNDITSNGKMSFLMIIYDLLANRTEQWNSLTPGNLFIFVMQIRCLWKVVVLKKKAVLKEQL